MTTVTDNVSTQEASAVTCYGCEDNANQWTSRAWGWGRSLHCATCHADGHRACAVCGHCLAEPDRYGRAWQKRWDQFYCSPTCRVHGKRERDRAAMERAAWEAEHPEEAAKERAEYEAWVAGMRQLGEAPGGNSDKQAKDRELQQRAENCAGLDWQQETKTFTPCARPFGDGDVIYRRHALDLQSKVLPYCEAHACPRFGGQHNRDLEGTGRYYPNCSCLDDPSGQRNWTPAEPCIYCGRPVRTHKEANPRRFVRDWMDAGDAKQLREFRQAIADLSEDERREAWASFDGQIGVRIRTFCSEACKRAVFATEAKAKRLARRGDLERRCTVCRRPFSPHRTDARHCSNACRQKAYRKRGAA